MKIIKNIIPAIKLYKALQRLTDYNQEILKARANEDFEREREYILKSTDSWAHDVMKTFDITLHVTGKENLPESGPIVFVANHQSFADILVTCAVLNKFQFGFIAKDSLKPLPFYGKWIKDIRSVYINRDDARASLRAIEEGIDLLHKGFSLMIFPEGSRSKGSDMYEFRKGSLRLATKPGIPVIPISIDGAYRIFEEKGYVAKGAEVHVIIHPAIETKGMAKSDANNLSAEVEKIVREGLVTIRAQNSP